MILKKRLYRAAVLVATVSRRTTLRTGGCVEFLFLRRRRAVAGFFYRDVKICSSRHYAILIHVFTPREEHDTFLLIYSRKILSG